MTSYGLLSGVNLRDYPQVNAELLRTRLWHGDIANGRLTKNETEQTDHLRQVATAAGQTPPGFLSALHHRRHAAAVALAARQSGHVALSVRITPYWRVVVGHGENSPHETSLSFSATYGVPIWPASGLKGVTASYARTVSTPITQLIRLFGSPRPDADTPEAQQGAVTVLDGLPITPPDVVVDVLTPHVKPYYDDAIRNPKDITEQPAEYHNPVPVRFLAVGATSFRTLLVGPADDTRQFFELLREAADDLGLGGKTAAGYGYCTVESDGPAPGVLR